MNFIFSSTLDNVIGVNNNLPYYIPTDLKYFHNITTKNNSILIVGHNTFLSLPKKIFDNPKRIFWVLSKNNTNDTNYNNVFFFNNHHDIVNKFISNNNNMTFNTDFFVIGGAQIFNLFISYVKLAYHTSIHSYYNNIDNSNLTFYKLPNYFNLISSDDKIDTTTNLKISFNLFENTQFNINFHKYIFCPTNYGEYKYLNILYNCINSNKRTTRNATTFSYFSDSINFDLTKGFPLLTTKKMFFKAIVHELLFFIKGETNTKLLENNGVNIWKLNTSRDFLDNNGFSNYDDGDMGPMYGYQWRHFNDNLDQFTELLHLMENDVHSRRMLLTTYNPLQAKLGVLYPCHSLIIQFYINIIDDDIYEVSIQMYQRSADVFLGLPFNIASTSLFLEIICNYLSNKTNKKYIPKNMTINLGDVHLYEQHYECAIEQLNREPLQLCKLNINKFHNNIDEYEFNDFSLVDYNSHPSIKAVMIA